MFDRILFALDDTPAGEMATLFVSALATRTGAAVHVFHVNEFQVGGRGLTLRTHQEVTDLVTGVVHQLAEREVNAGASVRTAPYRRVPAEIAAAARERRADVIVLGSHRHRRLGRLFSTQVRERTTRLTSLPVLTSPSPLEVTSLPGAGSWDDGLDQLLESIVG
jgi:nucleotide-binding universal stress UspA family protein